MKGTNLVTQAARQSQHTVLLLLTAPRFRYFRPTVVQKQDVGCAARRVVSCPACSVEDPKDTDDETTSRSRKHTHTRRARYQLVCTHVDICAECMTATGGKSSRSHITHFPRFNSGTRAHTVVWMGVTRGKCHEKNVRTGTAQHSACVISSSTKTSHIPPTLIRGAFSFIKCTATCTSEE